MNGSKTDQQSIVRQESFWDFSLRTYRMPGVADACLALQDEYAVDINMLLYCCWAGAHSGALCAEDFQRAFEFSRVWAEHVVCPTRAVRHWMKHTGCGYQPLDSGECMALREQVKAVELGAEKLQQLALESMTLLAAQEVTSPAAPVVANLQRYFRTLGIPLTGPVMEEILVIVRACCAGAQTALG